MHLRTPADVFPFATHTGRLKQADHTRPYIPPDHGGPPGQTSLANLGPLTRFHHRIKTHGAWQVKQPFPGIYLWRDPHGRTYLVDHTGTRSLGRSARADPAGSDITVHVHPAPGDPVEYSGEHRHVA